ncbi:protein unc-79 homolog isoform X4 [Varroa destructor]|uniref:Protein unc-79 homolog n=1 Tax=Varroa destructor TaxID=109461 RepID=A0A7M7JWC1_VARDE|nr:protein unc-79 homolog isoform X4 [Varroa destructor]
MGTRAAAFTAKVKNLTEFHSRIMYGPPPLPSGVDVSNTLKYFSLTLLSVLKDVPTIPLEMLRSTEKDHARISLFPSLDYKALYQVLVHLLDCVPMTTCGAHLLGQTILNTMACLVPFLEHEYMDTLGYIVASALAHFPTSLHKDIVDLLCNHLLPVTITNNSVGSGSEPEVPDYANLSVASIIMLVFQYTDQMAHQAQLLECLLSLKRDIVKDLLCVIAHGTAKARHPAVEMLFHYWPTLNPTLRDKKFAPPPGLAGGTASGSGGAAGSGIQWKAQQCQMENCIGAATGNNQAIKICLDHSVSISSGERPPPLHVCQACSDQIRGEHANANSFLQPCLLPLNEISLQCENKNCVSKDKTATSTCFSTECASQNGNRPQRLCGPCTHIRHPVGHGHIVHRNLPSPWAMDTETQMFFVEAVVSLLKEAQPSTEKGSKDSTTVDRRAGVTLQSNEGEESSERLAQEERQLLSRYGIWLLVGLCTPDEKTPPDTLGRLLGMLFQWFHYTACLPDDQTGNSLERLKTEYINGWLMDIVRTHFDVFVSCLLPHPAEYAQVGGHWDVWPSQTEHIKEGFRTLLCLVPYDIINRQVWEFIMPYWMEAFRFEIPEAELAELKILLSKVLDPDLSPLGFEIKQMYSFLTQRFDCTSARVQEQALFWLQIITQLEVPVPLSLLFSMFKQGVESSKKNHEEVVSGSHADAANQRTPKFHPVRQDTTGTMLSSLGLDGLPSSCFPQELAQEEKPDGEVEISCHILMLDILIKQLELQEINNHKGLNTKESKEMQKLIREMLTCEWVRAHNCTPHTTEETGSQVLDLGCVNCELNSIWFQLALSICEFICPVMEVAMADIPGDHTSIPRTPKEHHASSGFGSERHRSMTKKEKDSDFVAINIEDQQITSGLSVAGAKVHTAQVTDVSGETVAALPQEQVMQAIATAVTLTEDDVPEAKVTVAAAMLLDENDKQVPVQEDSEGFWVTSQGKFKINLEELPPHLSLVYHLLLEMTRQSNTDVLYHLLHCLKLLCLHAEVLNKAAHDHRGFLLWCQENLLVVNLWKLLQAECSQIARLCVPLLLHCVTLPSGIDQFWRCVEKDFHSESWLDRFSAVEKVTMIGHFMEPATVRNSPLLQSSLANAFCYLCHCMDDINSAVAQRALLCLDTIKTVSLKLFIWCLEAQFDTVVVDRPMILQTIFQLSSHFSERRFLSWDFFLNRFDALFMEAQILMERNGEIAYTRDLKNSNKNSEVFQRKLTRAQEALSLSRTNRSLTSSLATKYPYKRTMSAPGLLRASDPKGQHDKEKIHSRQCSAPVLKRKSSRLSTGPAAGMALVMAATIPTQHFPNSFFQGDPGQKEAAEEKHLLQVMQRTLESDDLNDQDTLHMLVFVFLEFLSRPDPSHPTEEKSMARSHSIVLAHLNILMGYSFQERHFIIGPQRLRVSPVFNAFLSQLAKVLDLNHKMAGVLMPTVMPVLLYCPAPQRSSFNTGAHPRHSLWPLDFTQRRAWLTTVLVILYKFDYTTQPLSRQVKHVIHIILNTLQAHNHLCKNITDPSVFEPVSSRSKDIMTNELNAAPSGGDLSGVLQSEDANGGPTTQNGQDRESAGTPSDRPDRMLTIFGSAGIVGGASLTAGSSDSQASTTAAYAHKPLARLDAHDPSKPHPLRLAGSPLLITKSERDIDEQVELVEQELEAIPESPNGQSNEGSNEVTDLELPLPASDLLEQAVLRVVKDAPPGSLQLTITEPASHVHENANVNVANVKELRLKETEDTSLQSTSTVGISCLSITVDSTRRLTATVESRDQRGEREGRDTIAEKSFSEPMEKVLDERDTANLLSGLSSAAVTIASHLAGSGVVAGKKPVTGTSLEIGSSDEKSLQQMQTDTQQHSVSRLSPPQARQQMQEALPKTSTNSSTSFVTSQPLEAPKEQRELRDREPFCAKRSLDAFQAGHGTALAESLSLAHGPAGTATAAAAIAVVARVSSVAGAGPGYGPGAAGATIAGTSAISYREKEVVYRTRSEQAPAPPGKPMPSLPCVERLLPIGGPQPSVGSKDRFDRFDRDTNSRQDRRFPFDPSMRLTQMLASRGAGSSIEIPSLERLLPVGPMPTRREGDFSHGRSVPGSPARQRLGSQAAPTGSTISLGPSGSATAASSSLRRDVGEHTMLSAVHAASNTQSNNVTATTIATTTNSTVMIDIAHSLSTVISTSSTVTTTTSATPSVSTAADGYAIKTIAINFDVKDTSFTREPVSSTSKAQIEDDKMIIEPLERKMDIGECKDEADSNKKQDNRKDEKKKDKDKFEKDEEICQKFEKESRKEYKRDVDKKDKKEKSVTLSQDEQRCAVLAIPEEDDYSKGAHIEESRSKLHYKQRKQRRAAEDAQRKYDAKSAAQLRRSRKINEVNFQSQLNASGTSKSNTHLPGGCNSVAGQFIRCILHRLSANGIFIQIFQGHFDREFFKVMASALADFNELNQLQPLTILFEDLNERKQLCRDQTLHTLSNVATYLEALLLPSADGTLLQQWSGFLVQLDTLLRRVILILATSQPQAASGGNTSGSSMTSLSCLLRIMTSVFKVPVINACKTILEPFSKILGHAIEHSLVSYQQVLELCHLCYKNMSRERDKCVLSRTVVFELVQALKFKTSIPDENLLMLVQFVLQDAGGTLCPNVILEDVPLAPHELQSIQYNTNAAECLRQNLADAIEFLADVHTLSRIRSNFHGIASRLNEETLGGQLKAGVAQYLALEITKGNGRENRAISKYLPWLYNPPSSTQQGPKEFTECVAHIRLLSWILVGALTHSALLGGQHSHSAITCQPIPLEANGHIAEHIQVILAGFAEQSKVSVLHMSSLFHAFILCQLWTMYCEHMVFLNPPGSEQNQMCILTLTDFWVKVTPGVLQLVCHSKLADMVSLHFLSLMEALMECNSTVLARLLPMWTPALYSYQGQIPNQLKVRLQACLDWVPPLQTREEATFVSTTFLKWLQRLQFKMGQIELQSSTATQFYSL